MDLVFPPTCVSCQRAGSYLCSICWEDKVNLVTNSSRTFDYVDDFLALAEHSEAIRAAIHALKYEHLTQIAKPLATQLAHQLNKWTFDAIIPIPLHYSRQTERGYNQASLLAQELSEHMNRPVLEQSLVRTRATSSQVGLDAAERQANVERAFGVIGEILPCILLIDDVCTTGSTLTEAAKALKQAGVETVYSATISLASPAYDG